MSEDNVKVPGRKPWAKGVWSDERIALLTRLWREGKPASDIAMTLGEGISRNAVIGKAGRLKLPPHSTSIKQLNHERSIVRRFGKTSKGASQVVRPQAKVFGETRVPKPKLAIAENGAVYETANSAPVLPPVNVRAWAPLPGSEPVTMMQLGPRSCRWPIDAPGDAPVHFCGRHAERVYCGVREAMAAPRTPGAKENLDRRLGIVPRRHAA